MPRLPCPSSSPLVFPVTKTLPSLSVATARALVWPSTAMISLLHSSLPLLSNFFTDPRAPATVEPTTMTLSALSVVMSPP